MGMRLLPPACGKGISTRDAFGQRGGVLVNEELLDLFDKVIRIEEIKQSIYRDMATGTSDAALKGLLESLYESRKKYSNHISRIRDTIAERDFIAVESVDSLSKKASWLGMNLERKREIVPTITSKMLVFEFLQRNEEECFEFHKLLRDALVGGARKDIERVVMEEKKEVEHLRQLAVRTLTGI
jgi:hypothetical protein